MEAQPTSTATGQDKLIGRCDSCGKGGALLYQPFLSGHHFCAECAKRTTLIDKAEEHLLELIRKEVLPAWAEHYKAQGLSDKELKHATEATAYTDWFEDEA